MNEEEMLEEIKSLSPSEEAILTMLIKYKDLKSDLYEANNRINDLLDLVKDKDKEIEYWKEQAEGYSGLAKQMKEDFEERCK